MLKGLVKDSAVIGTYKRIKHASKPNRKRNHRNQGVLADISDLIAGISEIVRIVKRLTK